MFARLRKFISRDIKSPAEIAERRRKRRDARNFSFCCGPSFLSRMPLEISFAWHRRENPREGEFIFAREFILTMGWPRIEATPVPNDLAASWTGRARKLRFRWPIWVRLERFDRQENEEGGRVVAVRRARKAIQVFGEVVTRLTQKGEMSETDLEALLLLRDACAREVDSLRTAPAFRFQNGSVVRFIGADEPGPTIAADQDLVRLAKETLRNG